MRLKYTFLIIFTGLMACLLLIAPKSQSPKELVIFDVHSDSPRIVKEDGSIEISDYVRIRNLSDHPYDLAGLFLSDDANDLQKLPLDGVVIESGSSNKIGLDPSWNFALDSTGNENVYLSDREGKILYKYSSAMKPVAPILSTKSGIYNEEFYLTITAKNSCIVRYTLDGSEPDENSEVYCNPIRVYDRTSEPNKVVNVLNTVKDYLDDYTIEDDETVPVEKPLDDPVDKAFIVRAVALDEYGNKSDITTGEYLFCGDKYKNIISVVADPDDLFGDYGILSTGLEYDEWYLNGKEGDAPTVNFWKKGREWEVPADMAYFRNGKEVLQQKCGLRLQGRKTRDRRIKNFQLRARRCYGGSEVFEYDMFDNEKYRSDGIILKDSFYEAFFLSLIENERILKQKTTERVALFLNGEFWNDIYIRQRLDERYFADHFGVAADNLLVLSESFPEISSLDWDDSINTYLKIDEYAASHDLSTEQSYIEIRSMMDIDSYIDYLAINEWIGNRDWGEFNNDMYWRVIEPDGTEYGDGKFRWIIHDTDLIFDPDSSISNDPIVRESVLYEGLMSNKAFRQRFTDRLIELGATTFSEENVNKELAKAKWNEPEIDEIRAFFRTRTQAIQRLVTNGDF